DNGRFEIGSTMAQEGELPHKIPRAMKSGDHFLAIFRAPKGLDVSILYKIEKMCGIPFPINDLPVTVGLGFPVLRGEFFAQIFRCFFEKMVDANGGYRNLLLDKITFP